MSKQGFTITQAAAALGKSSKTIYRWLADGKLNAQKIKGEWRILELPDQVTKEKQTGQTGQTGQRNVLSVQNQYDLASDIITRLEQENRNLAGQLGAAGEKIQSLENRVKLLTTGKLPWWRRLFRR